MAGDLVSDFCAALADEFPEMKVVVAASPADYVAFHRTPVDAVIVSLGGVRQSPNEMAFLGSEFHIYMDFQVSPVITSANAVRAVSGDGERLGVIPLADQLQTFIAAYTYEGSHFLTSSSGVFAASRNDIDGPAAFYVSISAQMTSPVTVKV